MYRLLLICLFLSTSLHSYSQKLLKDISSSDASSFINAGGYLNGNPPIKGDTLFFMALDTSSAFMNIWFTNGTEANTKNVTRGKNQSYYRLLTTLKGKVYYTNLANSNLYSTTGNDTTLVKTFTNVTIRKAVPMGNWLYLFILDNSSNILQLWKTDGTGINTTKVTDLLNLSYFDDSYVVSAGDKIYFVVSGSPYGTEPWVTDGTTSGTKVLKDILPGLASSYPSGFVKVGNTVFFGATPSNSSFRKLWKTDGTEAGTVMVANEIDGNTNYYPRSWLEYNNELYFSLDPEKLYKTDGNTITLVTTGFSSGFFKMNNLLYSVKKIEDDYEFWKSNGTAAGTEKITTIHVPQTYMVGILYGASKMYFQFSYFSNDSFQNVSQHWVSDGTAAGTKDIHTLNPDFSLGSFYNQIAIVGDTYYFVAYDAIHGFELWKSDGTSPGTKMVKNINTGIASSTPTNFVTLNNDVFFTADDMKYGREIWKTDGTVANTQLFMDYNVTASLGENYSSDILGMIAYNDVIIMEVANKIVKFSQTLPPTTIYSHALLNPNYPEFIQCNNKIFYKGYYNGGYQLFVTDGNTSYKLTDLPNTSTSWYGIDPTNFSVLGNELYFTTDNFTKMWKTDGTEAGTVLIKDFSTGRISTKFYAVNGLMLFGYQGSTYGNELWKTDGTEAGTEIVKDLCLGSSGGAPGSPIIYNNQLYFNGFDGTNYHLYKSDGTSANTQIVGDKRTSDIQTIFKNKLYFISNDYYGTPYYLWSTDGNSEPVKIQKVGESTMQNENNILLKNIDDKLLVFNITPTYSRQELWSSDGTTAGTKLTKIIRDGGPIDYNINIKEYLYLNKRLYFAANDGIYGKELWVWDFNCPESIAITTPINQETDVIVEKYIIGTNKINAGIKASYNSNKYITLNPGFETHSGARFTATMNGCINIAASAISSTINHKPFFRNVSNKADSTPSIFQFLNEPANTELRATYATEKSQNNEKNILWIIDESTTKYVLKMRVGDREWIGYLPK